MVLRYLLLISFISYSLLASGQEDTVYLDGVEVMGDPIHLFTVGSTVKSIEIIEGGQSLSELLSQQGNLYFKSYGNQQLATITMRGTSANQTNVLWHGIPVNYPTLGLMDFSQWPSWFISSIDLQAGSGGALFGSGAIGGTVLLDSHDDLSEIKPSATLRADIGSFGYSFLGAKGSYQLGSFYGRTKVYRQNIENDFTYEYNGTERKQDNAASSDMGIQQQLQWGRENHKFLFDGIVTQNSREVQSTDGVISNDHLETSNVRVSLSHDYSSITGSLNSTLAYVRNGTLYNDNLETISSQYSILSAYTFELDGSVSTRIGFNSNIYTANSANYTDNLDDIRSGVFGSITADLSSYWKASLNLRQSFFNDHYPFNPSFNQRFNLYKRNGQSLTLTQSVSTGFRFPTLNDLYWVPGGNPELDPEKSLSTDTGIKWTESKDMWSWGAAACAFMMWSENYILWRPGVSGIWSPENFQKVNIKGVEAEVFLKISGGTIDEKLSLSYAFTQSHDQTGTNSGNQLPYVPVHQSSITSQTQWNHWSLDLDGALTSRRYTTLDESLVQSVDGFFLVNLGINRKIVLNKWETAIGTRVCNLLDAGYENLINRSMPGRNYQLYLTIKR